ncbi:MAG: hypothetical protein NVSMB65_20450 [Chloroflexota bacterium]
MNKPPLSARDQALRELVHAGETGEDEAKQKHGAEIIEDLIQKGDIARKKGGMFSRGPGKLIATRQGMGKESEF